MRLFPYLRRLFGQATEYHVNLRLAFAVVQRTSLRLGSSRDVRPSKVHTRPRFNRASAAEATDASGRVPTAGWWAGSECIRLTMAAGVSLLTQSWPPPPGAYDYVLTLNDEEIAWEGLRRNAGYQRHYRLNAAGHAKSRRLPSGQSIWRVASHPSGCERWGLHPFCRSGTTCAGGSHPLAHRPRNFHASCGGQAPPVGHVGRPGPR